VRFRNWRRRLGLVLSVVRWAEFIAKVDFRGVTATAIVVVSQPCSSVADDAFCFAFDASPTFVVTASEWDPCSKMGWGGW
jgi:hypothetical protein